MLTKQRLSKPAGFTIVELLIVIVVIGILAAITIVAYNGIQARARDAQRLSDIKSIAKAIELYKVNNGSYPPFNSTLNAGGWEVSTNGTSATNFLSVLTTTNVISKVPVDPTNTGNSSNLDPNWAGTNYEYFYYVYAAGSYSCDATKGNFYVLGIARMDTVPSGQSAPNSPGFSCPGYNWNFKGAWVTGGFTN